MKLKNLYARVCAPIVLIALLCNYSTAFAQKTLTLSVKDYEDRVQAAWIGQIAGVMVAWPHEHRTASTLWLDKYPKTYTSTPVDDDWYYEMVAIRGFEKYGIDMTLDELGQQWKENACGSWGSSEQARLLMAKGLKGSQVGHPQYNKLWFSIGPQFSGDVYGLLAPGMPNLTEKIARELVHINGYAEGADGGVFAAVMMSLAFTEKDPKTLIRKAAQMINPASPYRQALDLVINMADKGKTAQEVFDAVEDRWHIEYPATNNAVGNGGIIAASVWFGEGDFLKTINLAAAAADFTDADCNAANAGGVIGAMHGMKAIPKNLVDPLNDRILGDKMGGVPLTPAVDETITSLAKRTVAVGKQFLLKNGAKLNGDVLTIPIQQPVTPAAEVFKLSDFTKTWNPDWTLERAGFGGAGGGMGGIRGITYLNGDVLATYPRDEIRGLQFNRTIKVQGQKELSLEVGSDAKRSWELNIFVDNTQVNRTIIDGGDTEQKWQTVKVDLTPYEGKTVKLRIYQRVLVPEKTAGNAYWKNFAVR